MASDVRIWTGTAWESIKGTNGAPGPSAVSTNAGQLAKLGTDNLVLVSSTDLDARYVNVTGDAMTGVLSVTQNVGNSFVFSTANGASYTQLNGGTFISARFGPRPANDAFCTVQHSWDTVASGNYWGTDYSATSISFGHVVAGARVNVLSFGSTGNITSTGTAHNFAANSITASAISGLPAASTVAPLADAAAAVIGVSTAYARQDHVHPIETAVLATASRTIAPSDMGRLLVNSYTGTSTLTPIKFTLPAAGDQTIPVGSWFDLCDASANSPTAIASPDGVNLLWNASLTGGSNTAFAGGTLSTLTINGMFSRLKVLKTAPLIWIVLG
jgi:hypothetical protein